MHALLPPIFIQKFCFFWWMQQMTRTHCISWCCLYYEKEINVLRLQSSQDTKSCFFGEEETQTSPYLGFELRLGFLYLEKPCLLHYQLQGLFVCCYITVSLFIVANSLNITFSSPNLSWYVWFYHIFIANKWKFSNHFFIDFFVGKAKSRCPISFHLLFIAGGYSSLSLSVSTSFVLLSSTFSNSHCCPNNLLAI